MLSALRSHGTLTVAEASATLHLRGARCATVVGRLADLGILGCDGERCPISSYWYPAAKRFLKRGNRLLV
ncbi:MAG: hypothetical protein P1P84_08515 [Deferrisomatales bacterium]|nr:hypothetical protein [Deferrisomatales bacterium]